MGAVYQKKELPGNAVFSGSTPVFTEENVPAAILKKHMAPKGRCAYLVVEKGALRFVWEDTGKKFDADPFHPIVIEPERFHHVELTGPVSFRIEFYKVDSDAPCDESAVRPGSCWSGKDADSPEAGRGA